ncbi:general stress protein [Paenibacillus physcomitrellae]|uniref:General stress protein 17M-like domain-containing protein n=1 Tax=Paenibacillus physcomitrellae TaxID=1619311 RepID=A0ABQ1G7B6_9BACL|nr:general stress protein [Paenibacillus physcomitrellae]GGA38152.1 hypothetical protein GCM10010917_24270 [Paenibacillus physcomitrellae]
MSKKWVGIFTQPEDVRETIDELKQHGFADEQLSVIMHYQTGSPIEEELTGIQAYEIGGIDADQALSPFTGLDLPDKEAGIYEEHMKQGRFVLIANDRDKETGEVYQIFQQHRAVLSNYHKDGDTKAEEHFYGVQSNADTYYGNQHALLDHSSRAQEPMIRC